MPSKLYGWGDYSDYYRYLADGTKIQHEYSDGQQDRYIGSLVYYSNGEFSAPIGGGRLVSEGNTTAAHYFLTDHLGSTRVVAKVTSAGCEDLDRKDYYPFGKVWQQSGMPASGNRYTFSGKEQQRAGLASTKLLDFGARFYDPDGVTFLQQDPLMEKYSFIGQYNYCIGNPIRYIDPNGKDVVISGVLNTVALQQLQARVGNTITLSMDDTGNVTYKTNTDKKLKGNAKRMAGMIDNNSITVNLITTDKNETSTGESMVGGAFMGNTVTTDADGNTKVIANQEVNPNVLASADEHTNTRGKMIMHEVTEAYAGAQISQKAGIGVGAATPADAANLSSVYNQAHNRATPQTPVYQTLYDRKGKVITDATQAVRVEYSVTKGGKSKVIQTYP